MLDTQMKAQLQAYLQNLRQPIRLVASLDGSDKSAEMRELLTDIAELSDKVSFEDNGADQRVPSFVVVKENDTRGVRFAAIPMGHEFTSLVLALRGTFVINPEGVIITAEVHSNEIARDVKETLRKLKAAQYTAANPGQVCPAKWNEGAKTLTPSLDLVGKI